MIEACAKAGRAEEGADLFRHMRAEAVEPNVGIFNDLIDACAQAGSMRRLRCDCTPWWTR